MSGCGQPPVVFNFANWTARYPEFATVPPASAQLFFDEATLYCANKLTPVCNTGQLTMLLYMLTAHVAALYQAANNPAVPSDINAPVGRISSAAQGTVNVQTENQYDPGTPQWYQQTKYGSSFWAATARFRTMRYRPGVRPGLSLSQRPWLYSGG